MFSGGLFLCPAMRRVYTCKYWSCLGYKREARVCTPFEACPGSHQTKLSGSMLRHVVQVAWDMSLEKLDIQVHACFKWSSPSRNTLFMPSMYCEVTFKRDNPCIHRQETVIFSKFVCAFILELCVDAISS